MLIPERFYRRIVRAMPIVCVDLLVVAATGEVLLLKRRNPPAQGLWWPPGGRVQFGETRVAAATRKLAEECGHELQETAVSQELFTADLILPLPDSGVSHAVSTVFRMDVPAPLPVRLDDQSDAGEWRQPREWYVEPLARFPRHLLGLADRNAPSRAPRSPAED